MVSTRIISPQVRRVIDVPLRVGESPTWDDRTGDLWFVDILAPAAFRLKADGSLRRYDMPAAIGCLALCESDDIAVCLQTGVHMMNRETGALTLFCNPDGGRANSRLNDGKVGPDGCLWVGTRDEEVPQTGNGRLYRVTPNGRFEIKIDGLKTSNGLAWSADGKTMYHSDSSQLFAQTFDFNATTGEISGQKLLRPFTNEVGRPDGAAMDQDGFYWIAGVLSGRVNRVSPTGDIVEAYQLPCKSATMPCFAGPDLKTLYVTTLFNDDPGKDEPGTIFAFEVDVAGVPVNRFAV
ncbi:SMP-30/gluconolactonase/LRE family protein [Rhizobium oryzicola]|uniref:SMP-30/gluconolactonase/LRE family protein n=1 Tax=Rhizobium oryzicola TaxID=1232668 RepID=A0ABT8SYQ5_9HYPH|nr:SMP-30/gluconolactonase/LRE family protein [Rhizobium oryzicola]MDO1583557.1 SMP-30/gluconolactonase/LRE family protein [Rhizobium oryzicola]